MGVDGNATASHARRKLWDIHVRQHKLAGTLAHQGLQRIGGLYKIEAELHGQAPGERRRIRQEKAAPILTVKSSRAATARIL